MKTLILCVAALSLTACGGSDEPEAREPTPVAERAPTIGTEIANDLKDPMERAKNVEEQAMQQKAKIDAALEAAEDP